MPLNIKTTNFDLREDLKALVREKMNGLEKFFNNIQQIDVEVGKTTKGQQKGNIFFCEINLSVPKKLIRYRHDARDVSVAITGAKKGIQIEIKKYKEKSK
ncbi:ribosome-associated translation inhibitor RaiA [Candidatus Falkowbacteria bacterium]|nr:ribosome-associated translation inhibitor RaiA [Candidatus Falkowbacteria bacterium]